MTVSDKDIFSDKANSCLRAVQEAGHAARTDRGIYPGRGLLFPFAFLRRNLALGIYDGSVGAYLKARTTFCTKKWIYVKPDLGSALDGVFRALLCASATTFAIFADLVRHIPREPSSGYRIIRTMDVT